MYIKANAKINLTLNVLNKRDDGYHNLDMINLPIALHDVIATSRLNNKYENRILINDAPMNFYNDICGNVVKLITKKFNIDKKYEFSIYKTIPMGGGLGGGSSDAAAIFRFYNKKFKLNISDEDAIKLLLPFGSDIPFFIINKPARVQGKGEIIKPIYIKNNYYVLIVKPQSDLSTKDVFKGLENIKIPIFNIDAVIKALETGDDDLLAQNIGNSLELSAIPKCPKIEEIKTFLLEKEFPITLMSGAGSSVFTLSRDKRSLYQTGLYLKKLNYNVFFTTILKGA